MDRPIPNKESEGAMEQVWNLIRQERAAQDTKWGGSKHDDEHNHHDWVVYLIKHIGKAVAWPFDRDLFQRQMIRVAALAVAGWQWAERGRPIICGCRSSCS